MSSATDGADQDRHAVGGRHPSPETGAPGAGTRGASPGLGAAPAVHGDAAADRGDAHADRGDAAADRGDAHADRGDAHADRGDAHPDRGDEARAGARNAQQAVLRARHAASKARRAAESEAQRTRLVRDLFAQPTRDHLYQVLGRPVAVLRAGSQAPIEELGLEQLRASGYDISVTTIDQDDPATRADVSSAAGSPARADLVLGDLRAVPLAPRSFDVVYCSLLLDRIPHAELVLDRFVAALRPGGLLLLRIRDRDCAAGVLDRLTPEPVRRMIWARLRAGEPGPFPAIYDPVSSARGIQAYTVSRGLVIIRRETGRAVPGPPGRLSSAIGAARVLMAWLSRGRLTDAHDELLYVVRKPEDRFARLV